MIHKSTNRKLAAILSADVKGYSRLMGEDEDFTVGTLTAYREIMTARIEQHRGRVVDSPGDNLLAEFASAVNAVHCAVEIQTDLGAKNAELPENRRMKFRIGINLGDVLEEGERIYGDGVNIAARLERLAQAGGICVSENVYEQIENKLTLGYEYLGEQSVKNIAKPVRAYNIILDPQAAGKVVGQEKFRPTPLRWTVGAAGVVIAGFAVLAIWHFYFRSPHSPEKISPIFKTVIPLSDRASIALLPFKNLSGDPEQEYFSDGITNDIITDLSKFRELLVIASNTVFTYKGKAVKVKEVGQELGVKYVLEGSVQRLSNKVRINAQLIDAATESHLWAERYDRNINDLFAVQNEIVQTIVTTLAIKVGKAERARAIQKDTDNLAAYDYVLRGREYYKKRTRSTNIKAKEMFNNAIELDPAYTDAYVALARSYVSDLFYGWTEFPDQTGQKALGFVNKALTLDEFNAGAYALLGAYNVSRGEYELGYSQLQRAIALNPNDASSHHILGWVMLYSGHTDEALFAVKTALRFDPNISPTAYYMLGIGHYLKGQYDSAINALKQGVGRKADYVDLHVALAATYAQLDRQEDALREAKTVLELNPFFEAGTYGTVFRNPADRAKITAGLRKAGLK